MALGQEAAGLGFNLNDLAACGFASSSRIYDAIRDLEYHVESPTHLWFRETLVFDGLVNVARKDEKPTDF